MPVVRVVRDELAYEGGPAILSDLSITFEPGSTGLVGANGAGKATLLRLVAASSAPPPARSRSSRAARRCASSLSGSMSRPGAEELAGACDGAARRWIDLFASTPRRCRVGRPSRRASASAGSSRSPSPRWIVDGNKARFPRVGESRMPWRPRPSLGLRR